MATLLLLAALTWLLHSHHSLQLAQDMVLHSGGAILSIILQVPSMACGGFHANATGSGGSGGGGGSGVQAIAAARSIA